MSTVPEARLRAHRPALSWGFVAFLFMVSAQIASPLADSALAALTTAVVVTLAFATFFFATFRVEMKGILFIFLLTVVFGLAAEVVGVRFGIPFGDYQYLDALQPQLFDVPVVVALAWFAMGLPAWEVSRRLVARGPRQWVVGGLLLAAWDLFLDPQMVANGYWEWPTGGIWQGIPLSNYVGWVLVGTGICFLCSRVLDPAAKPAGSNPYLAFLYVWMGAIETLGFLLPFVFDRPLIGVVGGMAMLIPGCLALRSYGRPWPR